MSPGEPVPVATGLIGQLTGLYVRARPDVMGPTAQLRGPRFRIGPVNGHVVYQSRLLQFGRAGTPEHEHRDDRGPHTPAAPYGKGRPKASRGRA